MNALNPNPKIFDYKTTYPPVSDMCKQTGMSSSFYQGGYFSPFTNNYHESPVHTEKEEIRQSMSMEEIYGYWFWGSWMEMEDILPEELR